MRCSIFIIFAATRPHRSLCTACNIINVLSAIPQELASRRNVQLHTNWLLAARRQLKTDLADKPFNRASASTLSAPPPPRPTNDDSMNYVKSMACGGAGFRRRRGFELACRRTA